MNSFFRDRYKRTALRKFLKLQSTLAVVLTLCLYSFFSYTLFSPTVVRVCNDEGSYRLLSTDVDTSLRPSLVQAISEAKESVLLIIYSLSDTSIIQALRSTAKQGVKVRVVFDPVETRDGSTMLGQGVLSYPRRNRGLMHSKLLVIDHTSVWLGSANLSTRSLTEQGNLVVAIRSRELGATIERLAEAMISRSPLAALPSVVQLDTSEATLFLHPYHGQLALKKLVTKINAATKRVFVAMFTFTHPDLAKALCNAHQRGVDVRVILDRDSAQQTSRKVFLQLKRNGVPCGYRTKKGLLHYKVAIIDDLLVAGSCNWTKAAYQVNHEATFYIDPLNSTNKSFIESWWKKVEKDSSLHP